MAGPLSNWGRWGSDDELGTLNHVSALDVTAAAALVRVGKVITLGRRIADPDGDPTKAVEDAFLIGLRTDITF